MTWAYRDIATFPARFPEAMREAVAQLNTPILFSTYPSKPSANAVASSFRHFRWCLRQKPGVNTVLSSYEAMFDFRTFSEEALGVVSLYLVAQPTKLSELVALNQHLAATIVPACQY